MAFCRNCGTQMVEGAAYCIKCGTADLAVIPYKEPEPQVLKKCGFGHGISSMVLGVFGLFINFAFLIQGIEELYYGPSFFVISLILFGGMPLLAVIFSIISMKRGQSNGFSKAGLITGVIGMVFVLIILALAVVSFLMNLNPMYYF